MASSLDKQLARARKRYFSPDALKARPTRQLLAAASLINRDTRGGRYVDPKVSVAHAIRAELYRRGKK